MTQKPSAAMPNAGFVHLHVHSAYSLLKGSIKIQKLAELAKADRQPALALTDTDNMFGSLEGDAEDLIVLTGGPEGPISLALNADHAALAAARCDRLAGLFGDRLYVELQRHGIEKERRAEAALIDLAYAKGFPVVATNEPYFALSLI